MTQLQIVFSKPLRRVRVRSMVDGSMPAAEPVAMRFDPRMEAAARAEEERHARLELSDAIVRAMDAVGPEVAARLDASRDWIIELAFELAGRVLEIEVDRGNYSIQDAIRGCLDAAFETDTVLDVVVHPEDAAAANEVLAQIQEESGMDSLPRVTHNLGLSRGACRVETRTAQFRHDPRVALDEATDRMREALAG